MYLFGDNFTALAIKMPMRSNIGKYVKATQISDEITPSSHLRIVGKLVLRYIWNPFHINSKKSISI